MIDLQRQDGIFVLRMTSGENRFNLPFLDALDAALDEVERAPEPTALVTTGDGKFYSNGLDLEWMSGPGRDQAPAAVGRVHLMLGRLLAFPVITVAALNGHAFAGGAMLALTHDFRVMRADRGYFCLPEVDIRIPFTPGMSQLIQAKLAIRTAHEAMVTGRRYNAEQAVREHVVHEAAAEADVLPRAIAIAKAHAGKHVATLGTVKKTMYAPALGALATSSTGRG